MKQKLHIIYRTSDTGYNKIKPKYINNYNCLRNAIIQFPNHICNWTIIADNVSDKTYNELLEFTSVDNIQQVSVGHGGGTFNLALDHALTLNDDDIVYFLENDYLHKTNSYNALLSGFSLGASFISLYDHPDKYMDPSIGGNPYCESGAEDTRVYLTDFCHWKITNSTTMTFASTVKTIKRVEPILRKHTTTSLPNDYNMFIELREQNELLITPIPGYSTHGETAWLSPLINWEQYASNNA